MADVTFVGGGVGFGHPITAPGGGGGFTTRIVNGVPWIVDAAGALIRIVGSAIAGGGGGGGGGSTNLFDPIPMGADITITGSGSKCYPGQECQPGWHWSAKHGCCVKTRRRRKRMLTCTDKADIGFIMGTMGKSDMAKSAIAALIARCN